MYREVHTLRFPQGKRIFTDGSLMAEGGEGAAYFDEADGKTHYVRTQGEGNINRAELLGILKAIQDHEGSTEIVQIFTDSAVSLKWIRRWV